ncbi:uncharacterized protein METZ01_LOCUS244845 [marine metagenome]|uniref:Uncharacterized protein n=1 Tax=marine metagenome TaxID=408172 RepID=A0A382HZV7_9ZZZZ
MTTNPMPLFTLCVHSSNLYPASPVLFQQYGPAPVRGKYLGLIPKISY